LTRDQLINIAVDRFYSPNADNEVAVIRFRDGKSRRVSARELISGRLIAQVARAACELAFERHVTVGDPGLTAEDIETAVSDALGHLGTTLTPANARAYLPGLPQDIDAVAVEQLPRKLRREGLIHRETDE
jgi:hypothetical protein